LSLRTLSIVVVGGAALGLACCTQATDTTATAPGTTAPATAAPTASSAAPPPAASSNAAPSNAAPSNAALGDDCRVDEATLLAALEHSPVGRALESTKTLTDIECYRGYALALTHPKHADNAVVVYRYSAGSWRAVNGGTAGYCDGVVPAAVRKHLPDC
jgi:hypothetical protein